MINEIQKLQFALMEKASFNDFDGQQVVNDLIAHEDLWEGVIMGRAIETFLPLRDIARAVWNVDTLAILSSGKDDKKLKTLARGWKPSTREWINPQETAKLLMQFPANGKRILYLWWD